jgi:hypothetical protein
MLQLFLEPLNYCLLPFIIRLHFIFQFIFLLIQPQLKIMSDLMSPVFSPFDDTMHLLHLRIELVVNQIQRLRVLLH